MLFVRYKKIERKKKGHRQRKEKKKRFSRVLDLQWHPVFLDVPLPRQQ